ncbi:hypothetical protein L5G32_03555 [Gordonia sp. HY002]|uniref:hypothetical protein n=1 Tax=Gordonia zhenghanii TaxID=2911516 RepID=UPI001EF117B7|nr:hypothetical protein [Gordonia zhenghanii]MCF8569343.1 hypothetical protein [Gordonia zhenghanii]MCF8604386.1 hypothetical protein [Gordonia zhenghanii]
MSVKFFRLAAITGAALIAVGALAACNDSTTTSAPIGTDAVTTTSVDGSSSSSVSKSADDSEASKEAEEGASRASSSAPETKPNSSTKVPKNFPGVTTPSGTKLTDSEKAYLADLKRQKVEFMGDTDNNVALTMGKYVCAQREQKTDSTMIKAFVTAAIGPMTDNEAQAKDRAGKVIRSADRNLC